MESGPAIARDAMKRSGKAAEVLSMRQASRGAAAMDVDRISGMGGVGQEQSPSWTREKMRRRKFVEEVPAEVEGESDEEKPAAEDDDHEGLLDVIA
jgi:hypothetical protein